MQSSDLQTSPGTVLMVAETEDQLVEDIQRLRNAESDPDAIYQVEDDHASSESDSHFDLPGMAGYAPK